MIENGFWLAMTAPVIVAFMWWKAGPERRARRDLDLAVDAARAYRDIAVMRRQARPV